MFQDGCTLWELLAAVRSTPVSDELPSPSVLLQGRTLRGSLPFLPKNLESRVPASFVQLQLHARQGVAAFHATRRHDVLSSVLFVGRTVRAHMGSRWLPGVVEAVCKEPSSYSVRLVDGRFFCRTRWAINNVQAPTESTANSTQVRSLRFPEVHTKVLSSAEAHKQTGVELATLAPP